MNTTREENAKELVKQIEDIFEGRVDDDATHFTGCFELCGKTADDALRQVLDDTLHNGLMNG